MRAPQTSNHEVQEDPKKGAGKLALVPVFPGTNCQKETLQWLSKNLEVDAQELNPTVHQNCGAAEIACVVVPGGFSYGDYLRAGALAARDPKIALVKNWAAQNTPVLGICNGFQILCEAGLLPGVLLRNFNRQHNHLDVPLSFSQSTSCSWIPKNYKLPNMSLPMSCGMGAYRSGPSSANSKTKSCLHYLNDWNGSEELIAAICNDGGNVMGMMPHPERASDPTLGSAEGLIFLLGLHLNHGVPIRAGSHLQQFCQNFLENDLKKPSKTSLQENKREPL